MSSSQRPLPDNTQRLLQTDVHVPGGIRTRNLSRQAAADRVATGTGVEHLWGIKKNFGVSLSICWSPVTALFAIHGYQDCELCRGIVN